jgi:hypothetical protein
MNESTINIIHRLLAKAPTVEWTAHVHHKQL